MRDGGLPYIAVMDRTPEKVEIYLEGIYNTVIVKDIEDRQARKKTDPDKRIYLFSGHGRHDSERNLRPQAEAALKDPG